jgi:hypothetical protein
MSALTIALMKEGPQSVIEWADAISDEAPNNYKSVAFQKAGIILAYVDPELASQWIEGHLDHEYSERALSIIGAQWAEQDSSSALAWLMGLPTGRRVEKAVRSSFSSWSKHEPEAATNWLLSVAPAAEVDTAVEVMVRRDRQDEPGAALEWAQRIHDPTRKQKVIIRTGQDWFRADPEAVRVWLSQSELSEEDRTEIQNPPARKAVRERANR